MFVYIYICPKTQKLANGTTYRAQIYTTQSMEDFQINYHILNSPFSLVLKLWTLEAGKRPQKRPQIRPLRAQYTTPPNAILHAPTAPNFTATRPPSLQHPPPTKHLTSTPLTPYLPPY